MRLLKPLVGFCVISLAGVLAAQTRDQAELGGRVVDDTGAVLPGVALHLHNAVTGHQYKTTSQEGGDFLFTFVAPGGYTLTAELAGFARLRTADLHLAANQRLHQEVRLKVGTPQTVLQVSADTNRVETTGAAIIDRVRGEELRELPLLTGIQGRNLLVQAPLLFPGASPYRPFGVSDPYAIGLSINGSPVGGIGFYFDGIDNNYLFSIGGSATVGPNPDAVEEFSAVLQTYGADTGGHQAQIQWRTKGGTNRFHGQGRAIRLDPDLAARDFFDTSRRTNWTTSAAGFQFSGPIVVPSLYNGRDRTLFMIDFETTHSRYETPARAVVLSDANRSGDFSDLPERLWPKDPETGQPFPGGRIPSSRILPQSRFYIDELIPPATQGSEISGISLYQPSGTQWTSRIDHQFSGSDTLTASIFVHRQRRLDTTLTPIGTVWETPENGQNLALRYTSRLSPKVLNSATFGRTWWIGEFIQTGKMLNPDLAELGYNLRPQTSGPTGLPYVSLESTSFNPFGGLYQDEIATYHWKDDLAFARGAHALKLGGEVRWGRSNYLSSFNTAPSFTFSGANPSGSGNDVADFLLGIPAMYQQGSDADGHGDRGWTGLSIQHDVKLRSNLTVNLGLRYEIFGVPTDRRGRNAAFRPGARSSVFPLAPAGALFGGDPGLGSGMTPPDHNNLAPRLGIAYSPAFREGVAGRIFGGPGRSSVRGGYGVYYIAGRSRGPGVSYLPPWYFSVMRDRSALDPSDGDFANPWGGEPNPFPSDPSTRPFTLPLRGLSTVDPALRDAYQHQWTLSLQRELPGHAVLELAYVGNRSLRLLRQYEANPGLLTPGANVFNVNGRRPYRDFDAIKVFTSDGTSIYHGFQASLAQRLSRGLSGNARYVWSRTMDDATGATAQGIADRDASPWGRADSDRRHNFVGYAVWELPGLSRVRILDRVLSGWQVAPVVTLRSGLPFLIRNQFDSTLRGTTPGFPDLVAPYTPQNPRQVQAFRLPNGQTVTGNFFIDPSVFRTVLPQGPEQARGGNFGRNVFSGPATSNLDVSLSRRFNVSERHHFDLRLDATNVLNHAQFQSLVPTSASSNSSQFGRAIATLGPRRVQLQVRYSF